MKLKKRKIKYAAIFFICCKGDKKDRDKRQINRNLTFASDYECIY